MERLEILGEDQIGLECRGEPLEFQGHVRLGQPLEIVEHLGQTVVQVFLEPVDLLAGERSRFAPAAVRACESQIPTLPAGLSPGDRLHERRLTLGADLEITGPVLVLVKAHDLDAAATGKNDPANRVAVWLVGWLLFSSGVHGCVLDNGSIGGVPD